MNNLDLLKGKKIKVLTEVGVDVELEIQSVKENHNSEDLEPATPQNDWWPKSRDWIDYTVTFSTGKTKTYNSLSELKLL